MKPTPAGIRDGRDELLEAAIRHILGPDAPAAVIENMAKAPEAAAPVTDFKDEPSGISWKLPAGWKVRDTLHWGDRQNTVFFVGPPSASVFTLYFQVLDDSPAQTRQELEKALHDDAEAKQAQRRREGRPDYTICAGSCTSRMVSGHPALNCIADFSEDGHAMAECLTFVRTGKLIVLLFGYAQPSDFDALRQSLDRMTDTISIP